jgi:eukaryotic-like serine/threonine-protein kinase
MTATRLSLEESQNWTLVGRLEEFLRAWDEKDQPPDIARFLPAGPPGVRREALVQFVIADLEHRLDRGEARRVEDYLGSFPELAERGRMPAELIVEEFQLRRARGEAAAVEEYYQRFPGREDELRHCLALAAPEACPTLFSGMYRTLAVAEGDTLDDFQLLQQAGEGGFARVFLARQISMRQLVAVKISADKGNEPQTLRELDHPHIVRVYDQRRLPEHGVRIMSMQYVAGGTLRDVVERVRATAPEARRGRLLLEAVDEAVRRGGQPPLTDSADRRALAEASWPEVVCRLGLQLAEALDYAHEHGVLHRDVKPANVLLAADGAPKLADFNISSSGASLESADEAFVGGSLAYMAPEHLVAFDTQNAGMVDARSDLYSLGVLLWELLQGTRPCADVRRDDLETTLREMIAQREAGPPPHTTQDGASLLYILERVLRRCLAPRPEDRYPSAGRLARDLRVSLNPVARDILQARPQDWRRWVRRYPVAAGLAVGFAPHAIATLFVFAYAQSEIVPYMTEAQQHLWQLQKVAGAAIGYGVGGLLIARLGWRMDRAARPAGGQTPRQEEMDWARRRALTVDLFAAGFGVAIWIAVGALYAANMAWVGGMDAAAYIHVIVAQTIAGCIAVVYPALGSAIVSLRVYYPNLVFRTPGEVDDRAELARLGSRAQQILVLAGAIPLLALLLYTLVGAESKLIVAALAFAGLLGLFGAARMSRIVQQDVQALIRATSSGEGRSYQG